MSYETKHQKPSLLLALPQLMGIMFFRFPVKWRIWIATLIIMNMGGYILFPDLVETQVTAIIFNVGAMLMSYIYREYGFVRLLGLGHIFWPFLIVWIGFLRLPNIVTLYEGMDESDLTLLRYWMIGLVSVNSFSVYLDIRDVYRYFKGERAPTLYWNKKDDPKNRA